MTTSPETQIAGYATVSEEQALQGGQWIAAEDVLAQARALYVAVDGEDAPSHPRLIDAVGAACDELATLRAQLAAQAEALAVYRGALTKWADLGTNYRHAITDEMLGQLFSLTDTTTQAHGCEVCAPMTADDGTICCWTCGRVIPDSLLGAQS